jgi:hypothetical protein
MFGSDLSPETILLGESPLGSGWARIQAALDGSDPQGRPGLKAAGDSGGMKEEWDHERD